MFSVGSSLAGARDLATGLFLMTRAAARERQPHAGQAI
jgi:hypothetical protein